ncbi:MAG: alkaline phosphatase family protein [Bacteroidales bacterium]|nr:alkaline phosphatase family protein [Bacteroidales bacterium]
MQKKNILILLLLISAFTFKSAAQKKTPPEKPKLIVSIVVEGMRYDYLYKYWDKFSEGGFKKLVNKGMFYRNAEYEYLYTKSSSGYATLVTGSNPSQHGIVNDWWYKRLSNKKVYCVYDKNVTALGTDSENYKNSPKSLLASTFSDELRLSNFKQSKVISISPKDYAAVLPAGHLGNAAYWFDKKTGNWISSSYYFPQLPKWVNRFNSKKFPDIYLFKEWDTFLPKEKYNECLGDDNSFEIGYLGGHNTFPYQLPMLKKDAGNYDILNYTPFGNTYTKDFAVSAIVNENLGKDEYCDYLNISFTASSNITKKFSIRSMEIADTYIRLDRDLQHFINFIDDFVGIENTVIILISDRGSTDSPRLLKNINMPGGYFKDKNAETLIKSFVKAIYNNDNFIEYFDGSYMYLNRNRIEDEKFKLAEIQNKIASFIVDFTGVANSVTSNDLESRNYTSGMLMRAQNSYHKKRSGDISIILEPGYVPGSDNEYGSGYRNFTNVPLIFYGWKIKAGESYKSVSITDVAPTLARFLQIAYPNASTGKVLEELF